MEPRTNIQNQQTGPGTQNNYNAAGTQNVSFVNSFNAAVANPHQTLWDAVAGVGASHNAEQQYERGECLKGTRRKALREIHDWRRGKGGGKPICWLSGATGVGKSAIAMTVAKSCEKKGAILSSFFFFRFDPRRNNHSALVPVIAHGLVTTHSLCRDVINQSIADDPTTTPSSCREVINQRISADPTILESRLEDQFRELVVKPYLQQHSVCRVLGPDAGESLSAVALGPSAVAQEAFMEPPVLVPFLRLYQQWWRFIWRFLFAWFFVRVGDPRQEDPNQGTHCTGEDVDASTRGVTILDFSAQEDDPENPSRGDRSVREEDSAGDEDELSEEEQEDSSVCTDGPTLVIIDGLDECDGEETQRRILSAILSAFQQLPQCPLKFLICSRPEAWIREAFSSKPLSQLSNVIVLDKSFMPNRDIEYYYRHHFQEIASSPKYNHVKFPSPWPSEDDLEDLVDRSCGQFVHAATTVRFIDSKFKHPITQLRFLLQKTPRGQPGTSPYQQLDALYDYILSVNPDYEEVRPILAAILIIPLGVRTPICIEMLLELPAGQVAVTLRGMHSVMDIRGPEDEIKPFHTSFRDYLVDRTRSGRFFIDTDTQQCVIARQWLPKLTTGKVRTYRYEVASFQY
ncbi:hypothetical protein AAF712_011582 [Marasmius tenuissimus]|uniref:Nephrocystin 3-like N-terminal domain-containing protein n=1 Tax=Marasmius tenuissimus TaxID=585030 RepID=A0ABR2ZIZ7_9AGAR